MTMERRDFLLLRRQLHQSVVDLSCERLYMQLMESQLMIDQRRDRPPDLDASGEPPAIFDQPTVEEVLDHLADRLRGADVLRIVDVHWLAGSQFRSRIESLCAAVEARGGRVEHLSTAASAADRSFPA
jgi:hypothetical protein